MPEIPKKLKWYTPLGLVESANLPPFWQVTIDTMTGSVEIKRSPLIRLATIVPVSVLGMFFGGVCLVCYIYDVPRTEREGIVEFYGIFFAPLFTLFLFVALDMFFTMANARHWRGSLRFRCDLQNGELFFARENQTYQRAEYQTLVLGCVRGVPSMKMLVKKFGVWCRLWCGSTRITQIFILVLDENDEWKRYDLADDSAVSWRTSESGSRQFVKLVEQLQPLLTFDTFVRDYSRDECYEQQNRSTG